MGKSSKNRSILAILAGFLLVSLAYSIINPPFEATDELRHFRFIRSLLTYRQLPVQGEEPCRSQSHHPPLYYAFAALAIAPIDISEDICDQPKFNPFWAFRFGDVGTDNKNQYFYDARSGWDAEHWAVEVARVVNILFGAGTVWLTWKIGRNLAPDQPAIATSAAAIVAFNPMFNYMSAAINNDIIAAFSSSLLLLLSLKLLNDQQGLSWQWGIKFGLVFGLAMLSKFNNAAVAAIVAIEFTFVAIVHKQWRTWLSANIAFALTTLLVSG